MSLNITKITVQMDGHVCTNNPVPVTTTATVKWTREEGRKGMQTTHIEVNCDDCGWELEPSDEIEDAIDTFLDNVADSIEEAIEERGEAPTCRAMDSDDDNAGMPPVN